MSGLEGFRVLSAEGYFSLRLRGEVRAKEAALLA